MQRAHARVNEQGRLVIPAEIRAAAGIEPGSVVTLEVEPSGRISITSAQAALKEARALLAKHIPNPSGIVDEFIRERREEAERE